MVSTAVTFIIIVTLTAGCLALEWESRPDPVVYSCMGGGVVVEFPWRLGTLQGVEDIHWFFHDSQTPRLLATYAHGEFLHGDGYKDRVSPLGNAGVTLTNVTKSDAGNYNIEVLVRVDNDSLVSYTQTVHLQVADGLMVDNGKLEVTQDPTALWDAASEQWMIRLLCGHFTFLGAPPMAVEWTLPSGRTQESTGYENGRFFLYLAPQLSEGNYTCAIPSSFYNNACTTTSPGTSATLYIDEIRVRLTLVEADNSRLGHQQEQMMVDNKFMQAQLANLTDLLQEMREEMLNANQSLRTEIQELRSEMLEMIECADSKYTVIDDASRSVNFTNTWYYGSHCDNGLAIQWYRLKMNGQDAVLPTACPQTNTCNTGVQGWLDLQGRELPQRTGQTLDAQACWHNYGNCCDYPSPIVVRKCGSFFLYKLQASMSCNWAYCFQLKD